MAKAPKPGVSKRQESAEAARQIMTITVRGATDRKGRPIDETHTLAIGIIPMRERVICRKATGLPVESFVAHEDRIGLDSIAILWWLARRANGEINLRYEQAMDEWPKQIGEDDIEVEVEEPDEDADDPEA